MKKSLIIILIILISVFIISCDNANTNKEMPNKNNYPSQYEWGVLTIPNNIDANEFCNNLIRSAQNCLSSFSDAFDSEGNPVAFTYSSDTLVVNNTGSVSNSTMVISIKYNGYISNGFKFYGSCENNQVENTDSWDLTIQEISTGKVALLLKNGTNSPYVFNGVQI